LSLKFKRILRKENVAVIFSKGKTMQAELCRLKPKKDIQDMKNIIYKIPCKDCPLTYIGETQQFLQKRIYQHKYAVRTGDENNGLYMHNKITGHAIHWGKIKPIEQEKDWRSRKIKESILINSKNPSSCIEKLMNIEKGIKIADCWTCFARDIREKYKL
jgi:hypothetical protein